MCNRDPGEPQPSEHGMEHMNQSPSTIQEVPTRSPKLVMREWIAARCPATDNAPVSMTEAGWLALCAGTQKEQAKMIGRGERQKSRCTDCKGEHRPKNLKIIKLNKKEKIMSKSPLRECEVCAEKATLRQNHGCSMCTTCSTVFAHVNVRLPIVAKAIAHLGKVDEMLHLIAPGMSATGAVKVAIDEKTEAIMKRIAAAVKYQGENPEELAAIIETLGPEYDNVLGMLNHSKEQLVDAAEKLADMTAERDALGARCGSLESERDALADRVSEIEKDLESVLKPGPITLIPTPSPPQVIVAEQPSGAVSTEIFNLALAQIEGEVSGISANRLRALARVQ
jgi:hypothetical protein